jgi:hypothetical protein
MRKVLAWGMGLFLVFGFVSSAAADELAELKQQLIQQQKMIQQQNQMLNQMMARIEQLESQQKQTNTKIETKVGEAVQEKKMAALPDSLKWVENVKINGDLRYRHESIDSQSNGDWRKGVNQHRIRARLGIGAKINDDWDVMFRIASGSADPVSTNQTLDNSFSSKAIWLDLAYFTWHPASRPGLKVFGGKMQKPFYRVGGSQLIWDDDLNPEGIAAAYEMPFGENNKLHVNGGGFWVDKTTSGADTSLWTIQTYLKHNFQNDNYLLGGLSYFGYGNIKGRGDLKSTWSTSSSFFGNTSSGGKFVSNYELFEAFAEYAFKVSMMPVAVFGDYVKNQSAATSADTGWLIGCTVNKTKAPGSWQFGYNYRDLEADAVLGAFSDSDFIGGGTDGKGHQFAFKYQLAKNLQGCLTYFCDTVGSNNDAYRRLQADLVLNF